MLDDKHCRHVDNLVWQKYLATINYVHAHNPALPAPDWSGQFVNWPVDPPNQEQADLPKPDHVSLADPTQRRPIQHDQQNLVKHALADLYSRPILQEKFEPDSLHPMPLVPI